MEITHIQFFERTSYKNTYHFIIHFSPNKSIATWRPSAHRLYDLVAFKEMCWFSDGETRCSSIAVKFNSHFTAIDEFYLSTSQNWQANDLVTSMHDLNSVMQKVLKIFASMEDKTIFLKSMIEQVPITVQHLRLNAAIVHFPKFSTCRCKGSAWK